MLMQARFFHIPTLLLASFFGIVLIGLSPKWVLAQEAQNCACERGQSTFAQTREVCEDACKDFGGVRLFTAPAAAPKTIELKNPLGETKSFEQVLDAITKFLIQIGAAILVVVILVAGFQYMTAGGNAEKVTTAHKTLTYALVGYGIIVVARGLVIVLRKILGG